jgi:hypothetical protein
MNGHVMRNWMVLFLIDHLRWSVLVREWQEKWKASDTARFAHSILPRVSLRPWFESQREGRKFVSTVSSIISGLCAARSHLSRFRIVEEAMSARKSMKQWTTWYGTAKFLILFFLFLNEKLCELRWSHSKSPRFFIPRLIVLSSKKKSMRPIYDLHWLPVCLTIMLWFPIVSIKMEIT